MTFEKVTFNQIVKRSIKNKYEFYCCVPHFLGKKHFISVSVDLRRVHGHLKVLGDM